MGAFRRKAEHTNDIILSTVRTYLKAVAKIDENEKPLIASTGFVVLRAKENEILPSFLNYAVLSDAFISLVEANSVGISYPAINASVVADLSIPVPPLHEQSLISRFLDLECARIDSVIDQTRASIEEYKKLKQAVITQAVTKGIRPDRQMKDSGVEWIGEIPSDWNILRKLSYSVNKPISYGIIKLFDPDDENGVKVIRCSDVREGIIDSNNIRTVTKEISDEYSRTILEGGEVLINVRGTLGGCAVVPTEMKGYNIAREVAMVSIDNTLLNKFLMYYFLSDAFINYENRHLAGSVYIGLNIEMLSACPITLPSTVEQQGIVDYLDEKTGEINRLIEKKQQLLSDLDSYKKSLIYEYVTGKKEVPA